MKPHNIFKQTCQVKCHSLRLLQFEIVIRSVTSLLANQYVESESRMCVNGHVFDVKVQTRLRHSI